MIFLKLQYPHYFSTVSFHFLLFPFCLGLTSESFSFLNLIFKVQWQMQCSNFFSWKNFIVLFYLYLVLKKVSNVWGWSDGTAYWAFARHVDDLGLILSTPYDFPVSLSTEMGATSEHQIPRMAQTPQNSTFQWNLLCILFSKFSITLVSVSHNV